jgi:phosphoribosylglycinamide formyltransferase-1
MSRHNIAIFVSGTGSNARVMIDHFKELAATNLELDFNVAMLISNSKAAKALEMAAQKNIPTLTLDRSAFRKTEELLDTLKEFEVDFIVLAGFLWLIPPYLVRAFPNRIVNIHPALLPTYGGKGMYGMNVHRAVKAAGETESGITIHYVNEHYDEGAVIFQASTRLEPTDTPEDIATKVLRLEHSNYSRVVEEILTEMD